jgi:hypothetical protein
VALQSALVTLLGSAASIIPGIDSSGMFQHALLPVEKCLPLIGLGLLWVLVAPNTQEVFGAYEIALGRVKNMSQSLVVWRPTYLWGVGLGLGLGAAIFIISGPSPFLYFRF